MDIGFVTYYAPDIAGFAATAGFDALELFVGPGSSLDPERLSQDQLLQVANKLHSIGLQVSSLTCSVNHLTGDPDQRARNNAIFRKTLKMCRILGTSIMTTNTWGDRSVSPAGNLKICREVFSGYARMAEAEGIVIAMENCPHLAAYPGTIGNIGYSPEMWDAIFDAVPDRVIGLEFDPSHLYWQGIDIPKAIRTYKDRIFAFHAKDCEILPEGLARYGILGRQIGATSVWDTGWWRYRIPGMGQIDWQEIFKVLYEIDYTGPMVIEHEDPVFGGDRSEAGLDLGPRTRAGLCYGLQYLRRFMPECSDPYLLQKKASWQEDRE